MPLKRPAAGGESCRAGFFVLGSKEPKGRFFLENLLKYTLKCGTIKQVVSLILRSKRMGQSRNTCASMAAWLSARGNKVLTGGTEKWQF